MFISHDDVDHTGNVNALMDAGPERHARRQLVHDRAHGRLARRCRRRASAGSATASRFDVGDRTLHAVRPPIFDSPTTRGLFDPTTGVYWASDCFATPMLTPVRNVADLDHGFWLDGMTMFDHYVSPWLELVDDAQVPGDRRPGRRRSTPR